MVAAMEGNTSIGSILIENGAELDERNNGSETALSLAAHTGHASFVDLLLRTGASFECHPHGNTFDVWLNWRVNTGIALQKSGLSSTTHGNAEPSETISWVS